MSFFKKLIKLATSKTVLGAVLSQIPALLGAHDATTLLHAAGVILGVAGARDAIDKAAAVVGKVRDGANG